MGIGDPIEFRRTIRNPRAPGSTTSARGKVTAITRSDSRAPRRPILGSLSDHVAHPSMIISDPDS